MRYRIIFTTDLNFYSMVSALDHIQALAKTNLFTSETLVHCANYYDHFRQYAETVKVRAYSAFSFPRQSFPTVCTIIEYTGYGLTVRRAPAPARPDARGSNYEIALLHITRPLNLLPGFVDAGKDDFGFMLLRKEQCEYANT